MANWSTTLDGLSGLSAVQKGKARLILMEKSEKEASLLVSGDPDVAAEAIKALLRKAGGASLTSPIPRIGMTGLVTAGAFLMLFKAVVQAVCSIEAEPGCPAWVTSSAALGDAPLSKVLLYGGVWAHLGAHQLAALAAERMQLQAGVNYVGSVLPGWVRFVPAWVRHFTAWAAVEGLALTAALAMYGASVLVHSLVLDLAVRLGMWLRFR